MNAAKLIQLILGLSFTLPFAAAAQESPFAGVSWLALQRARATCQEVKLPVLAAIFVGQSLHFVDASDLNGTSYFPVVTENDGFLIAYCRADNSTTRGSDIILVPTPGNEDPIIYLPEVDGPRLMDPNDPNSPYQPYTGPVIPSFPDQPWQPGVDPLPPDYGGDYPVPFNPGLSPTGPVFPTFP